MIETKDVIILIKSYQPSVALQLVQLEQPSLLLPEGKDLACLLQILSCVVLDAENPRGFLVLERSVSDR